MKCILIQNQFTSLFSIVFQSQLSNQLEVFCHSAITSAEQDHEIMVQSMVNEQERIRAAFADLFRQMDKASFFLTIRPLVYIVAKLVCVKLSSFL